MKVHIHSKDDLSKIVIKYIICLIPLYIYGIYKNGILLLNKDLISIFNIFKPIYLILLGVIVFTTINLIFKRKLKLDLELLSIFIIPLFMPPNINYLIYICGLLIGLLLTNILKKFININNAAFIKLLIVILVLILGTYSYQNRAEALNIYAFNTFDLLWGRNIGGIGATSIILSFIILAVLSIITTYKYQVSIPAIGIYILLGILFKEYDLLLIGSNITALVLVSPNLVTCPIKNKWMVLYGILIGILGFFLCKYVSIYEGIFISILFWNILLEIVCKITKKVL